MTDQSGAERRAQPFRLDPEQQKKRAKELCRALRSGDPEALARLAARHPNPPAAPQAVRLADAQLVIARELGLPSWPALRRHVEQMARSRAAVEAGGEAPDAGPRTLHLRCGSDLRRQLPLAGFCGAFLEYSNPFCQGPVPAQGDLVAIRAAWLAEAYGEALGLDEAAVRPKLEAEERALATAAVDYERVVLWFEHDHYDQLVLLRVLAAFAEAGAPPRLELVSADRFPGGERFIGLGQLPPEGLRLLWDRRRLLGPEALALGSRGWAALRAPDPSALAAMLAENPPALPHLAGALLRHLQELPWAGDGLGLTQRLTLELLAEGSATVGRLFARLMREREPRPWLGDVMFLAVLEAMERAGEPPFARTGEGSESAWPQRRLALTEVGAALLAGRRDWLDCGPLERWVGGVRIAPGTAAWRWDEAGRRPVLA